MVIFPKRAPEDFKCSRRVVTGGVPDWTQQHQHSTTPPTISPHFPTTTSPLLATVNDITREWKPPRVAVSTS
jgi:hypothetical protein